MVIIRMLFTDLLSTFPSVYCPYIHIAWCSHKLFIVTKWDVIVIIPKQSVVLITYRSDNSTNQYVHKQQKTVSELEWLMNGTANSLWPYKVIPPNYKIKSCYNKLVSGDITQLHKRTSCYRYKLQEKDTSYLPEFFKVLKTICIN